ncbi:MAG: outer membrane beta-barrel protein [Xanthomonadales bacterium]|nr:outer membrane beta-barrel protein [Xanthomonadales bacterium]
MRSSNLKSLRLGTVALGVAFCFATTAVYAQNYDDPALGQQPVVSQPQDYKPLGFRAGSFMLHPGVELAVDYNDNVFYSYQNEQSDTIFHVRPYITAQSTWSRHSFSLRLAADVARYADFDIRDYEDYFVTAEGKFDFAARNTLGYRFDILQLHEDLNSRDSEQGIEPTVYNLLGAGLNYDHYFNRLSLGAALDWRQLTYDDVLGEDGNIIDNEDRDRNQMLASLKASYQFKTDKQAFLTFGWDETEYDQPIDRNGFHRDSSGYFISGGLNFTITSLLIGDVSVGYHKREYDDPQLESVDGIGLGAGLSWSPTQLTTVRASVSSGIEDTTSADASGYFRTLYSLRVDHELLRNLQLSGRLSYSDSDYQSVVGAPPGSRSNDQIWRAGIGMNYFINRWMFVGASYDFQDMSTNVANDGYKVNRAWLVLGFEK